LAISHIIFRPLPSSDLSSISLPSLTPITPRQWGQVKYQGLRTRFAHRQCPPSVGTGHTPSVGTPDNGESPLGRDRSYMLGLQLFDLSLFSSCPHFHLPRNEFYKPNALKARYSRYARHRRSSNPLERPREIDITAHVDYLTYRSRYLGISEIGRMCRPAPFTVEGSGVRPPATLVYLSVVRP
jgi:hypothetical protein